MASVRNLSVSAFVLCSFAACSLRAQESVAKPPSKDRATSCIRAAEGSSVPEPADLRSQNGVLRVDLAFRDYRDANGTMHYCYVTEGGDVAPNLRLHPGDTLILRLKNQATPTDPSASSPSQHSNHATSSDPNTKHDPCAGGTMTVSSTNLHFHGLVIPAACHQDETLRTLIQPADSAFEYRFQIPPTQPPGLYWYHPHPHGFSKAQVLGGASGALIVEGIEQANPKIAELPERVLIIRDQDLVNPDAQPVQSDSMPAPIVMHDAEGDILNTGTGGGKPAKDLSLNFVPISFPQYRPAVIAMHAGERQLWRVLNASAITYLDLQLLVNDKPQLIGVVALDGIPLNENGAVAPRILWQSHVSLPPAARAEFIVKAPPTGVKASFVTRTVDTGPAGENDPTRPLAVILVAPDAAEPRSRLPAAPAQPGSQPRPVATPVSFAADGRIAANGTAPAPPSRMWLGDAKPIRERKLYFFEEPQDPQNPNSPTKFYITVEGQPQKIFDPNATRPDIIARQGDVEDWIIENRTQELHAFHIHQIHFLLTEWNKIPLDEPFLRDTVNVAYWDGKSPQYPSVRLRMDFRDPQIVGTFVYHCHLLEHEDGGMMGTIRVEATTKNPQQPAVPLTSLSFDRPFTRQ
jgi:FtsP/CotA-like multicopper oxidase with cupredoxin domain